MTMYANNQPRKPEHNPGQDIDQIKDAKGKQILTTEEVSLAESMREQGFVCP